MEGREGERKGGERKNMRRRKELEKQGGSSLEDSIMK